MSSTSPIAAAVTTLRAGGVIAYPTEGVWGLGCDPWQRESVERLLALKQRDPAKGLILIAADAAQLEAWLLPLAPELRLKFVAPVDRPTTWLVPDPERIAPDWVRGRHQSVALRLTEHPVAVALCREFGGPLVSTSANPASAPSARDEKAVRDYFGSAIAAYVPGRIGSASGPSIIRSLIDDKVFRGPGS